MLMGVLKVTVDNLFSSVGGLASAGIVTPQLGCDLDGQGNNLDDIGTIDADFSNSY